MRDGLRDAVDSAQPRGRASVIRFSLLTAGGVVIAGLLASLALWNDPIEAAPDPVPVDGDILKVESAKSNLRIVEKFARVVELDNRISTVYGFDGEVIEVKQVERNPRRIRVQAIKPGVTTMVLVDESGKRFTLDVFVSGDVRHLQQHLNRLFPDANVEAVELRDNDSVLLRGWVTQPEHITQMVNIAEQFYGKVLNQMQVGGVQQVKLKVKVMEVQRSKIRRLGINFFFLGQNGYVGSTPGTLAPVTQLSVPFGGPPGVATNAFSDSQLLLGITNTNRIFQSFIEALKEEGLLKIQAQPVLVTTNGRPATLVNGGEFPILVPQGFANVTVEFREFGVRMEAVPVILGNGRLRLRLSPEVSERDFTNSVTIQGLPIPGLTTRRVNTEVEMRFGETLMIGGLISHRQTAQTFKTPILGDLPYIGTAFSRKRYDEVETELIIMVTPEYVAPLKPEQVPPVGPGQMTDPPTAREFYLYNQIEVPKIGERCDGCNTVPGIAPYGHGELIGPGTPTVPPAPSAVTPDNTGPAPLLPPQSRTRTNRGPQPFPETSTASAPKSPANRNVRGASGSASDNTYKLRSPTLESPSASNGKGLIAPTSGAGFGNIPRSIDAR